MINKAIAFAVKAHEGQPRKGTEIPYIFHPLEVGMIVSRITDDEEVIAAAVLHDTVEDCDAVTLDDIRREFGDRVARIVGLESEDKDKSWEERKAATVRSLKKEPMREAKIVALGDKLSNIRCFYADYIKLGDELWQRFNMKDKRMQGRYYHGLCEALSDLSDLEEYQEFRRMVEMVFGDVIADE
ncbi:MAG TPA: HD domain-containing protein [Candidatus Anaerobutyricum stercoris]|uniref:HD domain-containing protein n=1 Tax=Candidatus Anaerobutyricum stercoris TaxID=2838457 RepID=A0A9D2EKE7_9FIRM|nr:HD domain-containing protein [Eubacterium sp. An3]OUO25967.1 phosphohydrolase [Eubacterium sp. An3]CVI68750.1 Guanosine-3',5'-bis(diphosphate) 3'-pyrophosphohydrolase [Eubacteriaceae bacterium CHKCI004]HIZ39138.1 HD domain-containing protein [Candidatus Anaerobutyricum stercoris]